jgi:Domain of unknown function (DUF4331)
MSHHYSGPQFGFPGGDARWDVCDLFAFPKPGDATKSILITDVHPSVGFNPPGPTPAEPFDPAAIYEIRADTDGDLVADVAFRFRFARDGDGGLTATVRRAEGPEAAGMGEGGEVVVRGAPVSTGPEARVTEAGAYRFFAGWRSDPFFFDALGVFRWIQSPGKNTFTGDDFFAGHDICSIALELPNGALGGGADLNLWHRTLVMADGAGSGWRQVDRGVRVSQTPFLVSDAERDAYLGGEPAQDERFVPMFAHALEHLGGYTPEEAQTTARTLLPDVLPFNPTRPAAYPGNGRTVTDDAVNVFLTVITNGKVTSDKTGPHTDLLDEFPFLGPPNSATTGGGAGSGPAM